MGDVGDYLNKRAKDLGLDRLEILKEAQKKLDELYSGRARAVSLNDGVLKVTTPSAAVASELRLHQTEFLKGKEIKRIQIQIS